MTDAAGEAVPPGNYGYAGSGYSACEEENERLTESLRSKVSAIKSVSMARWGLRFDLAVGALRS